MDEVILFVIKETFQAVSSAKGDSAKGFFGFIERCRSETQFQMYSFKYKSLCSRFGM